MDDKIWEQTADDRYVCTVTRAGPYLGDLWIVDLHGNVVAHKEQVHLSYDAKFGPDMDDVADWQLRCMDVIDNPEKRVL